MSSHESPTRHPPPGPEAGGALAPADPHWGGDRLYRTLAEAFPQLVWSADIAGQIRYVNGHWLAYTGSTLEDLNRLGWTHFHHPDDLASLAAAWKDASANAVPVEVEYRYRRHDGEYRWFLGRTVPLKDDAGTLIGWVGTSTDIHDRRASEETTRRAGEVARAAEDQARTAAMQALEAESQARRAEAAATMASEAKDQFLAVLSHELRTPLTPVLTAAQMLETDPRIPPELREIVAMISRNVELEARIIDDLLDLTRLMRGKLELHRRPTDVNEIVRAVTDDCRAELRGRGLSLDLDLDPGGPGRSVVLADAARLQQVLWNLLRNAIKFTPTPPTATPARGLGRTIAVRTTAQDHALRIEVTDQGVGIEPSRLESVFAAFDQGDPLVARRFGGLGLGLAIAKALVEMHGGRISAASPGPGRGTTITVLLPLHVPATPPAESHPFSPAPTYADPATPHLATPHLATPHLDVSPPRKAPPAAPRRLPPLSPVSRDIADPARPAPAMPRLLLVEDSPDTSHVLQRLLSFDGYDVRAADCVATALRIAAAEPFDLLVSDIGLPDGTGLELVRQLRTRQGPRFRAVAVSGFGTDDDVARSLSAGFDAHLTKPVNISRLRACLRDLLKAPVVAES